MKVRATMDGFIYGSYKFSGSVFEIRTEKEFSSNWMEKVSDEEEVKTAPTKTGGPFANPKEQTQPLYDLPVQLDSSPTPLADLEAATKNAPAPDPQEGGSPTGDQFMI